VKTYALTREPMRFAAPPAIGPPSTVRPSVGLPISERRPGCGWLTIATMATVLDCARSGPFTTLDAIGSAVLETGRR
jgi:hypothetical protein